jgi:hypothetical protein
MVVVVPINWAGFVATVATNPTQIAVWNESRPDGGVSG